MKAYLFSFTYWHDSPPIYILVYADSEYEARKKGARNLAYNNHKQAKPEDLDLCTYF